MRINKRIFFGNRGCIEECYHLHKRMEEAFTILGGIQQPPLPCSPKESCDSYIRECEEGEEEILYITNEIVKGLLGKEYKIIRDKTTEEVTK